MYLKACLFTDRWNLIGWESGLTAAIERHPGFKTAELKIQKTKAGRNFSATLRPNEFLNQVLREYEIAKARAAGFWPVVRQMLAKICFG